MSTLRTILIGGIVGGIVMGAAFLLLPDTPLYESLSMAIGVTAGVLTWRPAGQSRARHFAGCAFVFVTTFIVTLGIDRIL